LIESIEREMQHLDPSTVDPSRISQTESPTSH